MNISLIKDENALNEVDLRRSYIPFLFRTLSLL